MNRIDETPDCVIIKCFAQDIELYSLRNMTYLLGILYVEVDQVSEHFSGQQQQVRPSILSIC